MIFRNKLINMQSYSRMKFCRIIRRGGKKVSVVNIDQVERILFYIKMVQFSLINNLLSLKSNRENFTHLSFELHEYCRIHQRVER